MGEQVHYRETLLGEWSRSRESRKTAEGARKIIYIHTYVPAYFESRWRVRRYQDKPVLLISTSKHSVQDFV